jgi:hypothetical protein
MNQADVVGYVGAVFVFATFWMKTMIPLRAFRLASNFLFIGYGYLAGAYPPLGASSAAAAAQYHAAPSNAAIEPPGGAGRGRRSQYGLDQAVYVIARNESR